MFKYCSENMEIIALHLLQGLLIFWLPVGYVVQASTAWLWIREPALDNRSSTSGYDVISQSRINCARTCSTNDTCLSFFFIPGQDFNCQLHGSVLSSPAGLLNVPNAVYYVLDGASQSTTVLTTVTTTVTTTVSTTVSATTTPPQPFSCPPDDTIFRTVLLDDGSHFTYKVVKTLVDQSQAIAGCLAQGSHLTRITSSAKKNILMDLFTTCTGYAGSDYYVDGSNAADQNTWIMNNGESVPMTNDYWGTSYPNNPSWQNCLFMRADIDYKWDDCSCSNTYYFVCEK